MQKKWAGFGTLEMALLVFSWDFYINIQNNILITKRIKKQASFGHTKMTFSVLLCDFYKYTQDNILIIKMIKNRPILAAYTFKGVLK